jgi:hypothetical protein
MANGRNGNGKKMEIDFAKIAGLVVGGTAANILATQLGEMQAFQDDQGVENANLTAGTVLAVGIVGSMFGPKELTSVFDGVLATSGAEILSSYTSEMFQGVSTNSYRPNPGQGNTIY